MVLEVQNQFPSGSSSLGGLGFPELRFAFLEEGGGICDCFLEGVSNYLGLEASVSKVAIKFLQPKVNISIP